MTATISTKLSFCREFFPDIEPKKGVSEDALQQSVNYCVNMELRKDYCGRHYTLEMAYGSGSPTFELRKACRKYDKLYKQSIEAVRSLSKAGTASATRFPIRDLFFSYSERFPDMVKDVDKELTCRHVFDCGRAVEYGQSWRGEDYRDPKKKLTFNDVRDQFEGLAEYYKESSGCFAIRETMISGDVVIANAGHVDKAEDLLRSSEKGSSKSNDSSANPTVEKPSKIAVTAIGDFEFLYDPTDSPKPGSSDDSKEGPSKIAGDGSMVEAEEDEPFIFVEAPTNSPTSSASVASVFSNSTASTAK
jgi:hypothetical protein